MFRRIAAWRRRRALRNWPSNGDVGFWGSSHGDETASGTLFGELVEDEQGRATMQWSTRPPLQDRDGGRRGD